MNNNLKWQLSHALGYIALGMYEDAEGELMLVSPDKRGSPDVLAVGIDLYHQTKDWEKLYGTAEQLTKVQPDNPGGWVSCAYATRRIKSITDAQSILIEGETHHPKEPTIKYNLGCYACKLGEFDDAEYYIRKAISFDESFKKMAQDDPDLDELRDKGIDFA